MDAGCKDTLFPLFRVIALDDAHSAQRLGEPPRYLRRDLAALPENGPERVEGVTQYQRETEHDGQRHPC